jgi:putative ABC transport system permease protein
METLIQDLRYSYRMLVKKPVFTSVAVLTLALGLGSTTAIFSVINGLLLRPLPYPNPDQVVRVWQVGDKGQRMQFSDPNFEDLYSESRSFQALAQYSGRAFSVSGGSEPVRTPGAVVSQDFFDVLGVRPLLGRAFLPAEHNQGEPLTIIVSYGFWQRYLGGDPDLSSKKLTFLNQTHQVIGVMPQGFSFPPGTELWSPRGLSPRLPSRTAHNWQVVARLENSVALEQARQEASAIATRLKQQLGDKTWMADAAVAPLQEVMVAQVRPTLFILMGAVGFLLLIACANVVNLLLAQAASRQRELAVRVALGASRWRLARQFLAESLLLAFIGGTLGLLLAWWGVGALLALEPGNLPRTSEVSVDYRVLAFAAAASFTVALLLGLMTAWRSTGVNLQEALKAASRSQLGGGASQRLRSSLVVAQVMLTLVLLTGAGLVGRSLLNLLSVDPGFRTESLVAMHLSHTFPTDEAARARQASFHEQLNERLRTIPGVVEIGAIDSFPLSGNQSNGTFIIMQPNENISSLSDFERLMLDPQRTGSADYRVASEGYFRAMNIPLIRGRIFGAGDGPETQHVAVISESLARQRWPDEDPIGKLIQFGNMDGNLKPFIIVGIVGDVREYGLDVDPRPTFYGYYKQRPFSAMTVVLYGEAQSAAIISASRSILREADPDLPARFRTVDEIVSASVADRRFNLLLIGVFAGTALLLAVMGIYGVTAYSVAQRTQEIGVRMALGARPMDIFRMVLGKGLLLTAIGVALGLAGALGLTQLIRSLLYGVTPHDAITFAAAAVLLAVVSLMACFFPARRATKVDPMVALRYE